MPKRKGELRQDTPKDQVKEIAGSIRGNLMVMSESFQDTERLGRVIHNLRQLCRALETTSEHLDDAKWIPEKTREFRL